jgi:YVTN family beta-propeller protein
MGISISPDGSKVYVTNFNNSGILGDNTVSVINTAVDTVSATIPVGNNPIGVSVSPDGSKVYVAEWGDDKVSVINTATNTVAATIAVGQQPYAFGNFISIYPSGVGIAPQSMVAAGIDIYPNPASDKLTVTSQQSVVNSIEIFNLLGEKVYQSLVNSHSLSGVSPTTNVPMTNAPMTINVKDFPNGVYIVKVKTEKGMEVSKFVKE